MQQLIIINKDKEQAEDLKSMLSPHYFVRGIFPNIESLIEVMSIKTHIYVIIYCNKAIDNFAAVKSSRIIIYNSLENDKLLFNAIQLGIRGFVNHTQKINELLDIIEIIIMGGCYVSNTIIYKLFKHIQDINDLILGKKIQKYDTLSRREVMVFEQLLSGYSYKEISTNLGISVDTTRKHISRIYKKINIHSKGELYNLHYNVQIKSKQYNQLFPQYIKQH
jgi:DNA-binding NarL/FixJ family response regulator